jgi:hypothetical protein
MRLELCHIKRLLTTIAIYLLAQLFLMLDVALVFYHALPQRYHTTLCHASRVRLHDTLIISLIVRKAGARKVFAVDASDMAHVAKQVVIDNGLDHIIEVTDHQDCQTNGTNS